MFRKLYCVTFPLISTTNHKKRIFWHITVSKIVIDYLWYKSITTFILYLFDVISRKNAYNQLWFKKCIIFIYYIILYVFTSVNVSMRNLVILPMVSRIGWYDLTTMMRRLRLNPSEHSYHGTEYMAAATLSCCNVQYILIIYIIYFNWYISCLLYTSRCV